MAAAGSRTPVAGLEKRLDPMDRMARLALRFGGVSLRLLHRLPEVEPLERRVALPLLELLQELEHPRRRGASVERAHGGCVLGHVVRPRAVVVVRPVLRLRVLPKERRVRRHLLGQGEPGRHVLASMAIVWAQTCVPLVCSFLPK